MTLEQKLLLKFMAAAIRGERPEEAPEATDWRTLFQEAYNQGVPLLFFDALSQLQQIPEPVFSKSFALARRCTAHNLRAESTQDLLVSTLHAGEHPYVILKGEAAAAYYPKPELRLLGDVDFLLQDGHAEAVIETMKQQGFSLNTEIQSYHQALIRGSEQMELHFEVAGIPQGQAGDVVRAYLETVFTERELCRRENRSYYVPSHAHHGMILLLHMQHHMQSHGMGLRHLMDWACFVQRTEEEPFWQERLLPVLKKIGLRHYCAVMTKLCALFLEIRCPEWACYAPDALCWALMEDLLAGGNFGRKDKVRARSTNMLPDWTKGTAPKSKLVLLWRTLHEAVLKQHPEYANRPALRFLCIVGKILRYCALFCVGKRPDIWKAAAYASTRRSIYDELKMFEADQ